MCLFHSLLQRSYLKLQIITAVLNSKVLTTMCKHDANVTGI